MGRPRGSKCPYQPVARGAQTFKCPRLVPPRTRAKGQLATAPTPLIGVLALVNLTTRLCVPGALLALMLGHGDAALVAAAAVSGLSILRGIVSGRATEQVLEQLWDELVRATRRRTVAALRLRPAQHGVAALLDAIGQTAHFQSTLLPQMVSSAVGLLVVAIAVAWRLGPGWLGLGGVLVLIVLPLVLFAQRRLRRDQRVVLDSFAAAAHGFEVLIDGATELRAHGVEQRHSSELLSHVRTMACAERRVRTVSALTGLFPLGVALVAVAAPLRAEIEQLALRWAPGRAAEVALLGATALVFGLGLLRSFEGAIRTGAHRRALRQFLTAPTEPPSQGDQVISLRTAVVRFDGLTIRYPEAQDATPAQVDFRWPPGRGLALVGDNGAGKSSLARCVLGLQKPTAGALRFDDTRAADVAWAKLRSGIAYLPQRGHIAADRSVAWHLRLLGPDGVSDNTLDRALDEVGLLASLGRHDGGGAPLEVNAGELSGGERQRLHLARTLIGDPELVVLDEPEAGLDADGRAWLRDFIERLAGRSRVLLIAHDPAIVPAGFATLSCRRGRCGDSS